MLGTGPVEPTFWLALDSLPTVGWRALLGAEPVGAAKPPTLGDELPGVGSTIVSGMGPVDPTESEAVEVVRRALLKVGEASSVSGKRPVEATYVELEGEVELKLEGAVG